MFREVDAILKIFPGALAVSSGQTVNRRKKSAESGNTFMAPEAPPSASVSTTKKTEKIR